MIISTDSINIQIKTFKNTLYFENRLYVKSEAFCLKISNSALWTFIINQNPFKKKKFLEEFTIYLHLVYYL